MICAYRMVEETKKVTVAQVIVFICSKISLEGVFLPKWNN